MLPPQAERVMATVHVAMFDAVNSIERRYLPYKLQLPASKETSKEAAAAAAAATVLAALLPNAADEMKAALASLFGDRAARPWQRRGQQARRGSGDKDCGRARHGRLQRRGFLSAEDQSGRLRTHADHGFFDVAEPDPVCHDKPGAIPTGAAGLPYGRAMGERLQRNQEPRQQDQHDTFGAADRRRPVLAHHRSAELLPGGAPTRCLEEHEPIDCARFMALVSVATADAYVAVFEAKYHYDFWRPITAIRNGDIDDNPATERDGTWQPIDNTPMHPEYPVRPLHHQRDGGDRRGDGAGKSPTCRRSP